MSSHAVCVWRRMEATVAPSVEARIAGTQTEMSTSLILAGPTLGEKNTGICVFEAADEAAATEIMNADPVIAHGVCTGELRPFRAALLRGCG